MIIIAHASQDNWYADYIFNGIAFKDMAVWVDHYNNRNDFVAGNELNNVLHKATMMILVCSRHSLNSPLIQMQWQRFRAENKPVVLAIVDGGCSIPFELHDLRWVDFTSEVQRHNQFGKLEELVDIHIETENQFRHGDLGTNLQDIHQRAVRLLEAQAPTYRSGTVHFILPEHEQIKIVPVAPRMILGRHQALYHQSSDTIVNFPSIEHFMSRRHALMQYINGTLFIRDLQSANGTFINNRRLNPNKDYIVPNYSVIHLSLKMPMIVRHQP